MQTRTLILRNVGHYWRTNLAVMLGVATAISVLAGALLVGDSVRASLRSLFLDRLGRTDEVLIASGFLREQLAADLQADPRFAQQFSGACPIVHLPGVVTHDRSGSRASGVQVYGVDDRFWSFHGRANAIQPPDERQILVSAALAAELGCVPGESLLVRIEKPSAIPSDSLHGRKEDVGRTVRLTIREVLPASAMGEFSIQPQQSAVRAAFVSLTRLQKDLEQLGKVNSILISRSDDRERHSSSMLEPILKDVFALEDLGFKLRLLEEQGCLSLEKESGLIPENVIGFTDSIAAKLRLRSTVVFTYLANTIRAGGREIPYSLVTALDRDSLRSLKEGFSVSEEASTTPPIILNEWAARDLGIGEGEAVELDYYLWMSEGRLVTRTATFRSAGVVPVSGFAADRDLAPDYPGITESDRLSDWDPPFPIDLNRVRPKDEDYWRKYRTTPKAFIPLETGQKLWESRYGNLTALRFFPGSGIDLSSAAEAFKRELRTSIDPVQMGLAAYSVRAEGLEASKGATDFGEYFFYFSFFLVISALLLTALFFKLGVEQRAREIGLLEALGFSSSKIRALFLLEGAVLSTIGGLLGVAGALGYGELMMLGLRTWWVDAVGTTALSLHVSIGSLVVGFFGGIVTAMICIAWTLRQLGRVTPRGLLAGSVELGAPSGSHGDDSTAQRGVPLVLIGAIALALIGISLLTASWMGLIGQVAGFFGAGATLLLALLTVQSAWLRSDRRRLIERQRIWPVTRLGFRNATNRPGRSVLCIALFAAATFVIVAVDAFRRDAQTPVTDRRSGTGGFPLLAESLLPISHDPNTTEGREALNIYSAGEVGVDKVVFSRFRVRPGDDASCLNLYQPRNPRIIAPTGEFAASGRFLFQDSLATSQEEKENPWLLLEKELEDGVVPTIADANSIAYVLRLKLGDEIVLSGESGRPIRLKLMAALADSVFQGELLISEENFLHFFPEQEGYRFFLLEAPQERLSQVSASLEDQLSDFGFDIIPTAERLASFHRVENTYLSTFQTLGGLGLVLGTLGLATIILRNVLERRRELALLRAIGYGTGHFRVIVLAENTLLLLLGLITGTICALLAIAPAFSTRAGHLPGVSLAVLLLIVMMSGLIASIVATAFALRTPLLPALRSE